MCKRFTPLLLNHLLPLLALVGLCCVPARGDTPSTYECAPAPPHTLICPDISIFEPSSSHVRDTFGSTWFGVGITLLPSRPVSPKRAFSLDIDWYSNAAHGNTAYLLPIGVGYQRRLLGKGEYTKLFAGASADVVFTDIKDEGECIPFALRTAAGGSLFLGANLGNRWQLVAKYLLTSDVRGFDFSGASLSLAYRI